MFLCCTDISLPTFLLIALKTLISNARRSCILGFVKLSKFCALQAQNVVIFVKKHLWDSESCCAHQELSICSLLVASHWHPSQSSVELGKPCLVIHLSMQYHNTSQRCPWSSVAPHPTQHAANFIAGYIFHSHGSKPLSFILWGFFWFAFFISLYFLVQFYISYCKLFSWGFLLLRHF